MAKKYRKEEKPFPVDLPITPMLDMSFQILSFFIITFHPMPQEGQLSLHLPKTDDTSESKAELPPDVPDEKQDEYKILVTDAGGAVGNLAVQGPTGVTPIADVGNGKLENLKQVLKTIPKPKDGKKGPTVKIESSKLLKYSQLIMLMDICRNAGFDSVGIGQLEGGISKD